MKESGTAARREQAALDVLAAIGTGSLPLDRFSTEARWWWNGGLDLPVAEFDALLGGLHLQTESGIAVRTGLVLHGEGTVMVEATSISDLKNGKRYDNRYVFLFHFDGEAIRQVKEYSDSAHVLATFDLG